MTRKGLEKGIALFLTVTMAGGSLAGCITPKSSDIESNEAKTEIATAGAEDAEATTLGKEVTEGVTAEGGYTDYSAGFSEKVTIQIPVYDRAFEGWNPTDNYYTRWVQSEFGDKYNVNVEYVAIGRNTEVQDFMQMIAAGNAPDIIMHYDMPQMVNYYSEEALQSINTDEMAYYAPDYYEKLANTIDTYGKLNGENTFFFAERNAIYYNEVELVRKDWLDQVGLDLPTNLAEREEMALSWKEAGLGTLGDKLWTQSFIFQYPFITTNDETEFATYLDLTVAPFTWEPTKSYLKAYNQMYNEGIYDSEFYLNVQDTDAVADFVSGKTGTLKFRMTSGTDVISTLLANDPAAELAVLDPASLSPDGTAQYYENPPYGLIMGINSTTSDEERAAVWMFLNWMIQPENLFYLQNGIEGETYTMEDGVAVAIEDYEGEAKCSANGNKDYWSLVQEILDYGDEEKTLKANFNVLAPEGYEYLVEQAYDYSVKNADQGIITPIFQQVVASSSEYSADLNEMWQEFYVACITCAPNDFEALYEKYCQEYLDGGYQEILDEKTSYIESGDFISVN